MTGTEMKAISKKECKWPNSFTAKSPNAKRMIFYTSPVSQKEGHIASIPCALRSGQGHRGILSYMVWLEPID